ncbi:MAG: dihydrodipicolinate synthase family protein, partial [Stackebrandtia sp.]
RRLRDEGRDEEEGNRTVKGIFPALLTAYKADGDVDAAATLKLVDRLVDAGVHGLFVGGTAGEGVMQTVAERKLLLDAVVGHVAGQIPVIAHVGALDTRSTVALARHAAVVGAAAVSAVTPFYYVLSDDALAKFYRALAAAVDVPVHGYHIPALTGRELEWRWFADLAEEGVLAGLKYSAKDLGTMSRLVAHTPEDFRVYNGADDVLAAGLLYGAAGGIGSTYNIMPELFVAIYDAIRDGRAEVARGLQRVALSVIEQLERHDFLAFMREVLRLQGVDTGRSRAPLPDLDAAARDEIRRRFHSHPAFLAAREPHAVAVGGGVDD